MTRSVSVLACVLMVLFYVVHTPPFVYIFSLSIFKNLLSIHRLLNCQTYCDLVPNPALEVNPVNQQNHLSVTRSMKFLHSVHSYVYSAFCVPAFVCLLII